MGIFKFSDPMYVGSNVIVHQIQDFPYLLYIKLHLKMPGNEQLQISSPPTTRAPAVLKIIYNIEETIPKQVFLLLARNASELNSQTMFEN